MTYRSPLIPFSAAALVLGGGVTFLMGFRWGAGYFACGLYGLYWIQKDQIGRLGLIGFLLSLIGCFTVAGLQFTEYYLTYLSPVSHQPASVVEGMPASRILPLLVSSEWQPYGMLLVWVVVLAPLGLILFGMGMLRGGVVPHTAVFLLMIGGLMIALNIEKGILGNVVLGAALIWLGIKVWNSRTKQPGETSQE